MTRFRTFFAVALTVLLVALGGLTAPSQASAASTVALRCESTGGGKFICDATAGGNALYSWKAGSNAVITQYLGSSVRGSCTVDTIASVSVSVSYSVGGNRLGGGKATASFPCVEIAL